MGVDYIEGGWPGANPTDSAFFEDAPETRATLTAFGMTKRAGRSAANDDVLAAVLNAGTRAVCLVGKTHDFHVERGARHHAGREHRQYRALRSPMSSAQGREALFDAEHFFDGYKANPGYALECLPAALEAGARWVVLCDTNGGTLPAEIGRIVAEVIAAGIPGDRLGIHTHNDTENAVANTLAAIDAGARQVQGTLNGLGERCGNANLTSLIPTLLLKEPYAGRFETGVTREALQRLTRTSRMLDDILNRVPMKQAPYVGASAFAHKAGLHASAILKDPATYEHVDARDGGQRAHHPDVEPGRPVEPAPAAGRGGAGGRGRTIRRWGAILEEIKAREDQGYTYDTAQASFELLARRALGRLPEFFEVKRYKVTVERRKNKYDRMVSLSEAVVVVKVDGEKKLSVSESMDAAGSDRGPVNALAKALAKDLGRYSEVHRGHAAGRFQGPHHPGRHRGGDPRDHRQRGRAGAALVHRRGQRQHRRRQFRGAARCDHLEAGARLRGGEVTEGEVLAALYAGLDREGPGCPEDVAWVVARLGLAGPLRIADAGCGSGADSATLARLLPAARIEGVEQLPHLAVEARARCAGLGNVTIRQGDMARLARPFDLIWCAGALYFLGVTEGLRGWRAALAPGGAVAFSEPVLLDAPDRTVRAFWEDYPAITDLAGIAARVRAAGFETVDHRLIVGRPWAAYYESLAARLAALQTPTDPDLGAAVRAAEREIALWRAAPDRIAYALMLARPA